MTGNGRDEIGFGKGHCLSFVFGSHNNARSEGSMCASWAEKPRILGFSAPQPEKSVRRHGTFIHLRAPDGAEPGQLTI
jgi:hypothetical protein